MTVTPHEDITNLVVELARHAAAGNTTACRALLTRLDSASHGDEDKLTAVMDALLQTFWHAARALHSQQGLLAVRALIGELAHRSPDELLPFDTTATAARLILDLDEADSGDTLGDGLLASIGHNALDRLVDAVDSNGNDLDVIVDIPRVFALALPELHSAAGLELLEKFAREATAP